MTDPLAHEVYDTIHTRRGTVYVCTPPYGLGLLAVEVRITDGAPSECRYVGSAAPVTPEEAYSARAAVLADMAQAARRAS